MHPPHFEDRVILNNIFLHTFWNEVIKIFSIKHNVPIVNLMFLKNSIRHCAEHQGVLYTFREMFCGTVLSKQTDNFIAKYCD